MPRLGLEFMLAKLLSVVSLVVSFVVLPGASVLFDQANFHRIGFSDLRVWTITRGT